MLKGNSDGAKQSQSGLATSSLSLWTSCSSIFLVSKRVGVSLAVVG